MKNNSLERCVAADRAQPACGGLRPHADPPMTRFLRPLLILVLLVFLGMLGMGCSTELSLSKAQLDTINQFAGEAFRAEPHYVDQFQKGILPEELIDLGVRAAHFETQGLYLVFYGFRKEESGILVPRAGVVIQEKFGSDSSTESLGENLFWYHLKG